MSFMRKGFLIYEEMRSMLNFLTYEENLIFFFYQCVRTARELIEMGAYEGEKGMC
jgi:hypothetical protein